MGRERAVLIWQVHQQVVLDELRQVEERLAARAARPAASSPLSGPEEEHLAALRARARLLRTRLRALGPSPQAKMG